MRRVLRQKSTAWRREKFTSLSRAKEKTLRACCRERVLGIISMIIEYYWVEKIRPIEKNLLQDSGVFSGSAARTEQASIFELGFDGGQKSFRRFCFLAASQLAHALA